MTICSICNPDPCWSYTICPECMVSAKNLVTFINNLENQNPDNKSNSPNANSCRGLSNAFEWVKKSKELESFIGGFAAAFRDQIHTDIEVKPGHNGPSLFAHRALLASRSVVFKNMLESDGCKAAPDDTITLVELTHEELHALLEFLYTGSLPADKVLKHAYSLSVAADKYEIPYLQKFCEQRIVGNLSSSTALHVLEISDACSNATMKETVLNYISQHMQDIVFAPSYETFVTKNPHLCVEITRAPFMDAERQKLGLKRKRNPLMIDCKNFVL